MSTLIEKTIQVPSTSGPIELDTVINVCSSVRAKTRPTLLLLHFWGGSKRTWRRVVEELKDECNVIAPSLRGWGRSSRPMDPQSYRILDHVDDIAGLLHSIQAENADLLKHGIVLVGHSMGGKIAQVLLTRPDLRSLIRGLILLAPAPAASFQLPEDMREGQIQAYDSAESARAAIEGELLGATPLDPTELDALVADAVAGSPVAKAAWPLYGMREDYGSQIAQAVRQMAGLEVLVVVGALDKVEPEASVREKTVAMLRGAGATVDVDMLQEAGHLPLLEAPGQLVERLMLYLKRMA